VALGVAGGVALGVAGGVAGGVALGVAGGVALGVALGVAGGVAGGVALGVAGGVALGVAGGVALGVAWGVALGVGALRIVFYAFQIGPALWQAMRSGSPSRRLGAHPALGDELAVLPFPRLGTLLAAALEEDWDAGLKAVRFLLRDPFQRWAVAKGFARLFSAAPDPLGLFYKALSSPLMEEFWAEPVSWGAARRWLSVRALWLGEVGGQFVDATGGYGRSPEYIAWSATRSLRGGPHPQIAPLARFLLHILDKEIGERGPDLDLLEDLGEAARAVRPLPHGEEVSRSLELLGWAMGVRVLDNVADRVVDFAWLGSLHGSPLRPQVVEALCGLWDVATEITRYKLSTSPADQAASLGRAVGMLSELAGYVESVNLPERTLLRLAVARWQSLVAEEAGRLGDRALREMSLSRRRAIPGEQRQATFWARPAEEFPNPYKTGDPVYPPLFVGREDVFNEIRRVWSGKANPDSIIVYGHRRMGKSSILRNLGEYAPTGSLLVYADLKGLLAFAQGVHHLLRGLADEIAIRAQERGLNVREPSPADYASPSEAALSWRRMLREVLAAVPAEGSLILALDEFEEVENAVRDGRIPREI